MGKKKFLVILIMQIFLAALFLLLSFVLPNKTVTVDGSEIQYAYSSDDADFYMGGTRDLGVGSYDVIFHYTASQSENIYEFTWDGESCSQIHYDRWMNLLPGQTTQKAGMYLTAPVYAFTFKFRTFATATGEASLKISKIDIIKNYTSLRVFGLSLALLFLGGDLIGFWYVKTKDKWIFAAVLTGLLAALPLYSGYLTGGHDMTFHLYRLEGIKDAFLSGQFPARVIPTPYHGYGYPTPQYYPELFLYVPALLRMSGFALHAAFLIMLFAIHMGTALISYASFDYLFKDKKKAILVSAFYTLSFYRLEVVHYRYAVGEALAMMFMPLVFVALMRLVEEGKKDFAARKKDVLLLIIAFTGMVQSHLLTCLMLVFMGLIFLFVFGRRLLKNKAWAELLIAVVITLLLNMWFILPLKQAMGLNYYMRADSNEIIAEDALFVNQLFLPFGEFDGVTENIESGIRGEMPLTLGLTGAFVFVVLLILFPLVLKKRKEQKGAGMFFLCFGLSVFYMFLCTNLCPWFMVREGGPLFQKLFGVIQFPWRYLFPATFFEALALGYGLSFVEKEKWYQVLYAVLASLILISAFITARDLAVSDYPRRVYSESMRNRNFITKDYLDLDTDIYQIPSEEFLLGSPYLLSMNKNGTNLDAQIVNETICSQLVEVSLFLFPGYEAWDAAGNTYELQKGTDGVIGVVIPSGFHGTIHIGVKEKRSWLIADAISLITLAGCIAAMCIRKKNTGQERPV